MLFAIWAAAAVVFKPLHGQDRLVLAGATLVDGHRSAPIVGARIIVQDGRFICVSGPGGCPSELGDALLDLSGKWVTPGLIDTHVHMPIGLAPARVAREQRLRFALGITTVRDAGSGSLEQLLKARQIGESALESTPRIVVAARVGPEEALAAGVPQGKPLVELLAARGADAIKLKTSYVGEIWREEIRSARAAGIPVFGHTWGGVPLVVFTRGAVAAGISGISHIMAIPIGSQPAGFDPESPDTTKGIWAWHKGLWLSAERVVLDSLIEEMVAHNVWLEPTLAMEYYWGQPIRATGAGRFLGDPPSLRAMLGWREPPVGPAFPEPWSRQAEFVGDFIRRGGMVVAGSDGIQPGLDLHEEMRLIGAAAGSPMAGLLAATRNAAIALNRNDLGVVEVGRLADAVVYNADPLDADRASLEIHAVVKGGAVYQSDRLLAEFEAEYNGRVRAVWRGRAFRGLKLGVVLLVGLVGLLLIRRLWRDRRLA